MSVISSYVAVLAVVLLLAAPLASSASVSSAGPSASCTAWNYSLTHTNSVPPVLALPLAFNLTPTDDGVTEVDFGFSFPFYGQAWSSVNVSTNGNLQFGTANIAWVDDPVPMQGMSGSVFFYFVDLNPDQWNMQQAQTLGSAGDQVTIVRYNAVPVCPFGADATHNDTANDTSILAAQPSVTCDVLLYQANGSIEVRYYGIVPTPWAVDIGVQDPSLTYYTVALQHQVMFQNVSSTLVNTTLTFSPYCAQYGLVSTTTGRRNVGNSAMAIAAPSWSAALLALLALISLLLSA